MCNINDDIALNTQIKFSFLQDKKKIKKKNSYQKNFYYKNKNLFSLRDNENAGGVSGNNQRKYHCSDKNFGKSHETKNRMEALNCLFFE